MTEGSRGMYLKVSTRLATGAARRCTPVSRCASSSSVSSPLGRTSQTATDTPEGDPTSPPHAGRFPADSDLKQEFIKQ